MARFILGHRLRALGERHGAVEAVLYRLDRAFFGTLLWLIRRLPVDTASRLGARIGAALGPRFRKGRALDDNLRLALPDRSEDERKRIARQAWGNAGAVFAEYAHLDEIAFGENGARIAVEVLGDIRTFRDPAHPAVFVTAHQANWEVTAAAIARQGVPLAVVYSPPTNPLLDELLNVALFALLALEIVVVDLEPNALVIGALTIPLVLLARTASVQVPAVVLDRRHGFDPYTRRLMIWGGLRGALGVAMAFTLPDGAPRELFLVMTYCVVVFSIVVQGLTVGRVAARAAAASPSSP